MNHWIFAKIKNILENLKMSDMERYLNSAVDHADLENRLRKISHLK